MTDPKRHNIRRNEPTPTTFTPSAVATVPAGETVVRAIRTPATRPAETEAVEIRPVRRPAGSARPTGSLEALSATVAAGRALRPEAAERLLPETRPAPSRTTEPRTAPVLKAAPSPVPTQDANAPRSGWLSHALSDWLQEPLAPNTEPIPVSRPQKLPSEPLQSPSQTPASVVQVIRADSPAQAPAIAPEDLPLTLQEALASDLLPNLPVELLERLWEQEQAALNEEAPQAESAPPTETAFVAAPQSHSGVGTASGPLPSQQRPLSRMPTETHAVIPTLQPMFQGVSPFLARFLPLSAPLQMGLNARFCDLHAFLKYLHDLSWYGYLHVAMGDLSTYALVYEGRVVAAAAVNATGEQALGELLSLYEQGATMATYPLPPTYAHVLSGVGSRAWKFDLTEDFTGLYADPDGAVFYSRGEVVATMPVGLPYEGAFPAPLRPQTLILPRSFAGWAHRPYLLTLRGRDANNPITGVYHEFRTKYGEAGAQFIRALGQQQTPAEYAVRADVALHDLEALLQEFTQGGYLKEQGA